MWQCLQCFSFSMSHRHIVSLSQFLNVAMPQYLIVTMPWAKYWESLTKFSTRVWIFNTQGKFAVEIKKSIFFRFFLFFDLVNCGLVASPSITNVFLRSFASFLLTSDVKGRLQFVSISIIRRQLFFMQKLCNYECFFKACFIIQ